MGKTKSTMQRILILVLIIFFNISTEGCRQLQNKAVSPEKIIDEEPVWFFTKEGEINKFFMEEIKSETFNKGTILVKFKIEQGEIQSGIREMIEIRNSKDIDNHILFYIDYDHYKGVYARISGKEHRGLAYKCGFTYDKTHSIALSWLYDEKLGGMLNIYIDGQLCRVTKINKQNIPINLDIIRLGVLSYENVFQLEEAVVFRDIFSEKAIKKLDDLGYCWDISYNENYELIGYKREELGMCIMQTDSEGRLWGIDKNDRTKLVFSSDNGSSFNTFAKFDDRIRAILIRDNHIFVGVKGKLQRGTIDTSCFHEVLKLNEERYPINGWSLVEGNHRILVAEYGWAKQPARVFESKDSGETWDVILTLPEDSDHIHAIKIDPYTQKTWVTYGDITSGILYLENDSRVWKELFTSHYPNDDQCIDMIFNEDSIIFASDKTTSGAFLSVYIKMDKRYYLRASVPPRNLSNVYAIHEDFNDILWWYGNHEGVKGRNSTICLSPDQGQTIILAENLGEARLAEPYCFVENEKYIFLGNNRFEKPAIR
jgi:hypothetical protein